MGRKVPQGIRPGRERPAYPGWERRLEEPPGGHHRLERQRECGDLAGGMGGLYQPGIGGRRSACPNLSFWTKPDSHGNLCPTAPLTAAITQCLNYLYRIELQSNSVDFLERVDYTKTVKPQCMLVYGRSDTWGEKELQSLRILNAAYTGLGGSTYRLYQMCRLHQAQYSSRLSKGKKPPEYISGMPYFF